jgi:hypothetical protein
MVENQNKNIKAIYYRGGGKNFRKKKEGGSYRNRKQPLSRTTAKKE